VGVRVGVLVGVRVGVLDGDGTGAEHSVKEVAHSGDVWSTGHKSHKPEPKVLLYVFS
jgi:hypothetical protein